jgi:hypothetical protein
VAVFSAVYSFAARPIPPRLQAFIWTSERNGFANLYLYDFTGNLHEAVTRAPQRHQCENDGSP